jgi:hypothetical protein
MSLETGSYSPAEKADIYYLLKDVDQRRYSLGWANTLFNVVQPRYGIYFSEIEKLCREYELTTHFLAVPAYLSLKRDPTHIVIDPNGKGIFRPFLALCCWEGRNQLLTQEWEWGIVYEEKTNVINLEKAGIYASSGRLYPAWLKVYNPNPLN